MFVNRPSELVTPARETGTDSGNSWPDFVTTRTSVRCWRRASGPLRADPLAGAPEPPVGVFELGQRRERLGTAPDAIEGLDALGLDDRVAEALAQLVLAHLEIETEQPLEELGQRRRLTAPALERLPQLVERGQRLAARRVHDVLGVALDDRHRGLDAVDDGPLLGRGHDGEEVALAEGVDGPAQVGAVGELQRAAQVDRDLETVEHLAHLGGQVAA